MARENCVNEWVKDNNGIMYSKEQTRNIRKFYVQCPAFNDQCSRISCFSTVSSLQFSLCIFFDSI